MNNNRRLMQCHCGKYFSTGREVQVMICPACQKLVNFVCVSSSGRQFVTHDIRQSTANVDFEAGAENPKHGSIRLLWAVN